MKKIIIMSIAITMLSACNAITKTSSDQVVEPHMVAGSKARKEYCSRRRTHTQKDYFDCVKGYGGQHSQYSIGVVDQEVMEKEGK